VRLPTIGRNKPAAATSRTLTAAAARIDLKMPTSWQMFKLGDRLWQLESWRHYDICGEMRYVVNWKGQALSRCRLYAAKIDPKTGEPGDEATDQKILDIVDSVFGTPAGRAEAQRLMGINLEVAGECYVVVEGAADGSSDDDKWYTVSSSEVYRNGDDISVRRSMTMGGGKYTLDPAKDVLIRMWSPHPRVYDASDSTVRAILPVLREIEQSTKRVFAEIDSRLAGAGVFAIPDTIDFARQPGQDPGVTGFAAQLEETMATSLQHRDNAAAIVPIVIQVPADAVDKLKHITFESQVSEQIIGLRKDAVDRLAMALDIPLEILKGTGGSSHWNAWQVEETTIKIHIEPLLIKIADALNTGFFQPALKAAGVRNPETYTLWFDVSALAVRPNRSDQALQFNEKGLLSDEATRNYADFDDSDKPTDDETNVKWLRQLVIAQPALVGDPNIQSMLGLPAITVPAPPTPIAPPSTIPEYDQDGNPLPGTQDTTTEPADAGTRALPQQDQTNPAVSASALFFAAEGTVMRALEMANARNVPSKDRLTRYRDTPQHQLHTQVWVDPQRMPALLAGAWDFAAAQAGMLDVDRDEYVSLLDGYVRALMENREPHSPDLLKLVLARAAVKA